MKIRVKSKEQLEQTGLRGLAIDKIAVDSGQEFEVFLIEDHVYEGHYATDGFERIFLKDEVEIVSV